MLRSLARVVTKTEGIFPRCMHAVRTCYNDAFQDIQNEMDDGFQLNRRGNEKSVNQITLLGRVGRDPQYNGPFLTFSLATSYSFKNEMGELIQNTDWHRISVAKAFLKDYVEQFIFKGDRVLLTGALRYHTLTHESGEKVTHASVRASDVILVAKTRKRMLEDDRRIFQGENRSFQGERRQFEEQEIDDVIQNIDKDSK